MEFFNNLSFKWKLVTLVLLPIICMLFFAQIEIRLDWRTEHENKQIQELAKLSVKASSLVHEMQKERGYTAGYVGSGGKKFVNELQQQRLEVDKRLATLLNFVKTFDATQFGEKFINQLNAATNLSEELNKQRTAISDLSIPLKDAIAYYNKKNAAYLDIVGLLPLLSSDGQLANMGAAYYNFLNSKERAGVERAVLAGVFSQDKFGPGVFNRLQSLITIQNVYMDVFKSLATAQHIAFYKNTMQGEFIDATNNMRKIALENEANGQFGVDPAYWFKMQTDKINALKKVEDRLSTDLVDFSHELEVDAGQALNASIITTVVALGLTVAFLIFVQRLITKPLSRSVDIANAIANGKLDNEINSTSTDEVGELLRSLGTMQSNLSSQIEQERKQAAENNRIRQALDNVSANVIVSDAKNTVIYYNDAFKQLLSQNENQLKKDLPSLNIANLRGTNIDVFDKSSTQVFSQLKGITGTHREEITIGGRIFNIVANPVLGDKGERLGTVVEWADMTEQRDAETQVASVINAAVSGQLDKRLDSSRYQGFMHTLADGINQMLDAIVGPLTVAADYVERISKGDIPAPITEQYQGDFNLIKNNLNTCISAINQMVNDANNLVDEAVRGELKARADVSKHQGDFRKIIEGVNATLDAVVNPLNMAADYVNRIAKGDIPEPITDEYKGDFNKIKNNLNTCIAAINRLVGDANTLVDEAVRGELKARADESKHQGDFRKIIEGVNATLDAVVTPLNTAAEYVNRIAKGDIPEPITANYQGDFNHIKNNLNTCIAAINLLVKDANKLANAAVQGELSARADEQQHQGDFQDIIVGVNSALDAIVPPINECKSVLSALADGDLTETMKGDFQGEFAILRDAVNTSVSNLSNLVKEILGSSNSISTASQQIRTGNLDLSTRTEAQAASLEETAASLEELTTTVTKNTESTQYVNQLSAETSTQAEKGGEIVNQAVSAMDAISASSKKIADIIAVIEEIAFQTNLLALNAAVEAARAGEDGRGFAVVAAEVRNLAQRTGVAARDITDLIKDSVVKVEEGSHLVNESGTTLADIVESVKRVGSIIEDITKASEEQSLGINEVNKAIGQMDEMTQQNASLVEETSAASQSMDDLAQKLTRLMGTFKTDSDRGDDPHSLRLASGS
ncbi:methyl-accepting chemotaxis protein [Vibrio sp. S4M6]|uniref:methyl-accepting chemotaxis protein n=1 Tax=Vibrio sinus TaxID=2946865 RepID=UPI00202A2D13|nr:nitrate- and nitrite sensing domain-containing protein [Vibrio sinus]MCL9782658.1 methyl-accepting chemotaxis protein [Vibrio sinus]